ncbi:uncharacterized protein LOC132555181 [Ylistrum balloti]|uniref:uncharacterized protein LOC132555181 n=1 Tax=Ylistrum balloti TaxID=509963 RepID=UPI002905EDB5|nr:uncharacterized protein LOC132555181 [Ylistrum balloti]
MILIAVISLVLSFSLKAESLTCYQCADTQMEGPCQTNTADLAKSKRIWTNTTKASDNVGNHKPGSYIEYVKICPPEQKFCAIERIEDKGVMFGYIRDCSDGETISVNVTKFQNMTLNRNNFTTCAFQRQVGVVCITFCAGDFCNGPVSNSVGYFVSYTLTLLVTTYWILLYSH